MIVDSSALVAIVGLNFGDCLTYAVASLASQGLLYVGEDFAKTDLSRA